MTGLNLLEVNRLHFLLFCVGVQSLIRIWPESIFEMFGWRDSMKSDDRLSSEMRLSNGVGGVK